MWGICNLDVLVKARVKNIREKLPWMCAGHLAGMLGYYVRGQIRPGLTGIAQVYAPKHIDYRDKFGYDNLYVEKISFCLDLKLIFLSFWITFRGKWEHRGRKI